MRSARLVTMLTMALAASLLVDTMAEAQGLFNRGNTGSTSTAPARSGSMFSPTTGFANPSAGQGSAASGAFVGRGNPGTGFVGSRQAGQPVAGSSTGGSEAAREARPAIRNAPAADSASVSDRSSAAPGRTPVIVRPRHVIAFAYEPRGAERITALLAGQFARLESSNRGYAGLTVQVDDQGQATLRGQAASAAAGRLVEAMTRLEPGVRSVRNEMEIAAAEDPSRN